MRKLAILAILVVLGLTQQASAQDKPLHVVASFSVLADMVANVGGDAVVVKSLVGPDADTHVYQPTPADAKAIAHADLVFVNGVGFEGWMQRLIAASGYTGKVVVVTKGVQPRTMQDDEGVRSKEIIDPHAWQNLSNGRVYVKNIALALEEALPQRAGVIRQNAIQYDASLAKMDAYVREEFSGIPLSQRKIITSHDAFGYFGDAYGITFLAPVGQSTEAEASAGAIARLIEQIKTEGVKELFLENMTNTKLIQQIGRDTGARIGGTLYSDALSGPNGQAPTYLDMFRNNVPKLKAAMLMSKM